MKEVTEKEFFQAIKDMAYTTSKAENVLTYLSLPNLLYIGEIRKDNDMFSYWLLAE